MRLRSSPEQSILLSFLLIIALGAGLLHSPWAAGRAPLSWIDALFTAASALCVTGLSVVDIGTALSPGGQVVVLTLIQLGGLGIMTLSLLVFLLLGARLSLTSRMAAADVSPRIDSRSLKTNLLFIVAMTAVFEGLGAAVMFLRFLGRMPPDRALYQAVFHSISAFCNAGFSLFSDSLQRMGHDPVLSTTFMALIVAGGLGFPVHQELWLRLRGRERGRLSLQTRVALSGTLLLVLGAGVLFFLFERTASLHGRSVGARVLHSVFLSVTARTAGFNTLVTGGLTNASLMTLLLLMGIGGCPGSTAGGVKIHTAAVLGALVRSKLRGLSFVALGGRKIPSPVVDRSLAVCAAYLACVLLALWMLQISETGGLPAGEARGRFLDLTFESVSAVGTVGLSTGITPEISPTGKGILILLMILGRLGPLTLGAALQLRARRHLSFEYAEEDLIVG